MNPMLIYLMLLQSQAAPTTSKPVTSTTSPSPASQPVLERSNYGHDGPVSRLLRPTKWPKDTRFVLWFRSGGPGVMLFARGGTALVDPLDVVYPDPQVTYRYDHATGSFEEVPFDTWLEAGTPIHASAGVFESLEAIEIKSSSDIPFYSAPRRAIRQNEPLRTTAGVDLALVPIDDARFAVLSARQYRNRGFYYGTGEILAGCYFQQAFKHEFRRPVGPPIHLPLPVESGRVLCGQAKDPPCFIYVSETLDAICIVDASPTEDAPKGVSGRFLAVGRFADAGEPGTPKAWDLRIPPRDETQTPAIPRFRSVADGCLVLVKARFGPPVVLHLDSQTQDLSIVDSARWERDADDSRSCKRETAWEKFEIRLERPDRMLQLEGPRVHFAGKRLATPGEVEICLVPIDDRRVAVLSALRFGPSYPGPFFSAEPRCGGCYFQQIFSADGEPLGPPLHLPLRPDSGFVHAGLMPDGRHIMYISESMSEICVVRVERPE